MRIRRGPSSLLSSNQFVAPLGPNPTSELVFSSNGTDGTKCSNGFRGVVEHQAAGEQGLHSSGNPLAESSQLSEEPKSSVPHSLNQVWSRVFKDGDEVKKKETEMVDDVDFQQQISNNRRIHGNSGALLSKPRNRGLGGIPITKGETTARTSRKRGRSSPSLSNNCTIVNGNDNESYNNTSGAAVTQELQVNGTESNISNKRRRRPAVLMEGSRCSRVNGRGWRCCQQTLVGYSLCEHHLGKGRLRSMNSVRGQLGTSNPQNNRDDGLYSISTSPSPISLPTSLSVNDEQQDQESKVVSADNVVLEGMKEEDLKLDKMMRKNRKKIGIAKDRSMNSLLEPSSSLMGSLLQQLDATPSDHEAMA